MDWCFSLGGLNAVPLDDTWLLDGTFQPGVSYTGAGDSATVGDFNGDGKPDLVQRTSTGVSISLGNGDGTFQPTARDLLLGRWTIRGDRWRLQWCGKLDVAATCLGSQAAAILLGNSDATLRPPVFYGVANYPTGVAAAEVVTADQLYQGPAFCRSHRLPGAPSTDWYYTGT